MNKKFIIIFITAVLILLILVFSKINKCNTSVNIPKLLKEYVDNNNGVGAVVGLIDNGKISYYSYGTKSINSNDPVNEKTIFEIGSITKVFTTLALMDLVETGKVKLDDPIDLYLQNVKIPEKNGKKITLRHLATQTAGLPKMPDNFDFSPKNLTNPYIHYPVEKLYEFLSSYVLKYEPGEHYEYSNLGMGLLGYILTLITDQSYEELIKDKILNKLSMYSSGTTLTSEMKNNLAFGYALKKQTLNWDFTPVFEGAGAIKSSVEDMIKFLAANMGLTDTPLYKFMNACHVEQHATPLAEYKICFGWHIRQRDGNALIFHNGGTGGYRSFVGFDSKTNKGVVILTNSTDEFPDELGLYILDPIHYKPAQLFYDESLNNVEYLKKFTGDYELIPSTDTLPKVGLHLELRDGKLFGDISMPGQENQTVNLLPVKKNVFLFKGAPSQWSITFILDEKTQKVAKLEWDQIEITFTGFPK